ncbi:hypothetical protein H072_3080 [Dactylellina haptotyla CBS 200.50]|uniref:Uncharacterized protein n=1 Tax=Dactylellina haptotyla (strain CBS 200.50) TaxID=1284197 RepID=S8C5I3_DACHA|nr:hypothetical protein H072_3080 [Dactylellina haptotyla CBS 200.50]
MGLPTLPQDLTFENQHILVTGSNTGIGLELARVFLRRKAKVFYLVVRSIERGNAAIAQLRQDAIIAKENPNAEIKLYQCDQGSFESVFTFIQKLKNEVAGLNTVVLNAGVSNFSFVTTVEGWESNFHVNYFGTVLLALELLPLLKEGQKNGIKSHLLFTSSDMHNKAKINVAQLLADDVNIIEYFKTEKNHSWDPSQPYSISKLLLTMFTEELALHEKDVIITSGCPGLVRTELDRGLPLWLKGPVLLMRILIGREILKSAETLIQSAITDQTGTYWSDGVIHPHAAVITTRDGKRLQTKLYEQTLQKCKELDSGIQLK